MDKFCTLNIILVDKNYKKRSINIICNYKISQLGYFLTVYV